MRMVRIDRLHAKPLHAQMGWFISLRWLAGGATMVGAATDWNWTKHFPHAAWIFAVGAAILAYNVAFQFVVRHWSGWTKAALPLLVLAWGQIVLDLACLSILTVWTGGAASPLLGFFVFHMVFASLMLPRNMAFGGAAVGIAMVCGVLAWTGRWPATLDGRLALAGWGLTLVLTVWVANVITLDLRRQRRHLIRKNLHIRTIKNELQHQQDILVQQEKMVGLGQMAAGVAHEIANPLASMDGVLQLMLRKPDRVSPQQIDTLREQVARINRTVRQMTAFAHPLDDEWRQVSLNELVDEAVRLARMDSRARRIKIDTELSPAVGSLKLLAHAMEQVMINLLLNALDATAGAENPRVVVRTVRHDRWYAIEVSDNGHGIPPELMGRLFEPFFTTKPVGKGTGLGLSISYSLMQKQGGGIQVNSTPGAGTTFTLRLPRERSEGKVMVAAESVRVGRGG